MWGHLGMFPVAQRQAAVLSKAVVAMDARRGSLKLNLKVFKWKWHFSSVMMKYNKIQAWFIVGCEISHGNFFVSQLVTTHSNCFIDYASRFLHALSLPSVYPPQPFPFILFPFILLHGVLTSCVSYPSFPLSLLLIDVHHGEAHWPCDEGGACWQQVQSDCSGCWHGGHGHCCQYPAQGKTGRRGINLLKLRRLLLSLFGDWKRFTQ